MLTELDYLKKLTWLTHELKQILRPNIFSSIVFDRYWGEIVIYSEKLNFTYHFKFSPSSEILGDGMEDQLIFYVINTVKRELEPILFSKPANKIENYSTRWKEMKNSGTN